VSESNQALILGEFHGGHVAAIDLSTGKRLWSTPRSIGGNVLGLAVLEKAGLAIVAASNANRIYALRVSDGVLVSDLEISYPIHVATDPLTDEIVVAGAAEVTSVFWTGSALVNRGQLVGLSRATNQLLLTVIPPAPDGDSQHSHLIVASFGTGSVDVMSLPKHSVVQLQYKLRGIESISGFMTDRWGSALGVVVYGKMHVLQWPPTDLPAIKN
jgi:hypothetical protein